MDINKLIQSRRSIYPSQYSGKKVRKSVIKQLLENANWAPNHYHTEPWRFIVFENNGLKRLMSTLSELYKQHSGEAFNDSKYARYAARAKQVSHAIVVVVDKSDKPNLPAIEEIEAVACAVQNMLLTISADPTIGGYWSTGMLVYLQEFADFLELDDNQICAGIVYVGTLKENAIQPKSKRGPVEEKTTWIRE